MGNLEDALDHCLQQVADGSLSFEECLARYPQHADALQQLLHAGERLDGISASDPSPAFKARARRQLLTHMRAHPRRGTLRSEPPQQMATPALWRRFGKVLTRVAAHPAYALVLLLVVALLGITTVAQAALPTQPLYGWKRASEHVWRSVHPDPVSADLALSERRSSELIRVAGAPQAEAAARAAYGEALDRLAVYDEADARARIAPTLAEQQARLRAAGIEFLPPPGLLPPAAPPSDATPVPTGMPQATTSPTDLFQADPTATLQASSTPQLSSTPQPSATPQLTQTPPPGATEPVLPTTLPQVTVEPPPPLPETLPATTPDTTVTALPNVPTVDATSLPLPTLLPTLPTPPLP